MALDGLTALANTGTGTDVLAGKSIGGKFVGAALLVDEAGYPTGTSSNQMFVYGDTNVMFNNSKVTNGNPLPVKVLGGAVPVTLSGTVETKGTAFQQGVASFNGAAKTLDTIQSGYPSHVVDISGTFSGTFEFLATFDGTNYVNVSAYTLSSGSVAFVANATTAGRYVVTANAALGLRVQTSSWVSGTAIVSLCSTSEIDFVTTRTVDGAKEATLGALNAKIPALGAAAITASLPVSLPDDFSVIGSAASAINTNLLTNNISDWFDADSFHSVSIQVIGSAGITAGQIIFEETNDPTNAPNGNFWAVEESTSLTPTPVIAAFAVAASTVRMFKAGVTARYFRVRISTAFTGGTCRVAAVFSQLPFTRMVQTVHQATAANLVATVGAALPAGTNAIGDVGVQYRANATGAASTNNLVSAASTNAANIKATAGRLLGYDLANTTASWVYYKLHNSATAPTAGAGVFLTIGIPPNGKATRTIEGGIAFSAGIGRTTVTGSADTDATAVAAGAIVGYINYA